MYIQNCACLALKKQQQLIHSPNIESYKNVGVAEVKEIGFQSRENKLGCEWNQNCSPLIWCVPYCLLCLHLLYALIP